MYERSKGTVDWSHVGMGFGMLFGACIKIECIASLVRVKCIVLHVRFISTDPARSRTERRKAIYNERMKADGFVARNHFRHHECPEPADRVSQVRSYNFIVNNQLFDL
jgi:hypothetical protein